MGGEFGKSQVENFILGGKGQGKQIKEQMQSFSHYATGQGFHP